MLHSVTTLYAIVHSVSVQGGNHINIVPYTADGRFDYGGPIVISATGNSVDVYIKTGNVGGEVSLQMEETNPVLTSTSSGNRDWPGMQMFVLTFNKEGLGLCMDESNPCPLRMYLGLGERRKPVFNLVPSGPPPTQPHGALYSPPPVIIGGGKPILPAPPDKGEDALERLRDEVDGLVDVSGLVDAGPPEA